MKKILTVIIALTLALTMLAGCTQSAEPSAAPTTAAPTTVAPTTVAPTTAAAAPATTAPTSVAPATEEPVVLAPTSETPASEAPTTVAPTTAVPTTVVPTTVAPTTVAPTTAVPTTVAPTTVAPTTVAPTTVAPTTVAPTTVAPAIEVPEDALAAVGDELIYQDEVDYYYEGSVDIYSQLMDLSDAEAVRGLKEQLLDWLIIQKMHTVMATKLGFDVFTEDEMALIEANANAEYESYVAQFIMQIQAEESNLGMPTKTDEEYRNQAIEMMEGLGGNMDLFIDNQKSLEAQAKLEASVYQNNDTVTDTDIANEYESRIQHETAMLAESPDYATSIILPEGYVRVKHILMGLTPEQENELYELEMAAVDMEGNVIDAAKQQEAETKRAEYMDALLVEATAVYDRAIAGEDFDMLIATYNTDPGMQSPPYSTEGYIVAPANSGYVIEFEQAALALTNAGDISEPVATTYGYHILKRIEDTLPLETVTETIRTELQENKKALLLDMAEEEWRVELNVRSFPERLVAEAIVYEDPAIPEVPTTEAPASDAPATEEPATVAPATQTPATEEPATVAPATEAPATDTPASEAPTTVEPATQAPSTDAPMSEEVTRIPNILSGR